MVADNDGGANNHTNATVGELLEEWFALAGPGYSPKGARETRGVMDRNLLPFLGNVPLSKLGAADIDRFYRRLREMAGGPVADWRRQRFVGPTASSTAPSSRA